jgi:hypothetical protein
MAPPLLLPTKHTPLCLLPQKILEDLEDASNELMLSDEENIRYVIGECFVHMDKDAAEEKLQSVTDQVRDHNCSRIASKHGP